MFFFNDENYFDQNVNLLFFLHEMLPLFYIIKLNQRNKKSENNRRKNKQFHVPIKNAQAVVLQYEKLNS